MKLKIFGIVRLPRALLNKSKLRITLVILITISFLYHALPKLLFKLPPSSNKWTDGDSSGFLQNIGLGKYTDKYGGELAKREIVILHWTALWRNYRPARVLTADQCSSIQNVKVPQMTTGVFNIPCRISHDRRFLGVSDALVFHSFDLMWEALPEQHNPDQIWVYLQQESPIYTKLNLQEYPNTFNWTMTYRRDSDVYHPYGHIVQNSNPKTRLNTSALLKTKKKLIAWIVSSCDSHSKREYFVQELQKYVPVDIFGWCGQDCPSYSGNCYDHIQSTYKFYLSFENSLCIDYITEKFFNALNSEMVPVVYGGIKAQDYSVITPNHSYIDARSFSSPKDLANYLIYLDKTDEEYLQYFEWKNKFRVESSNLGWCNLCQRIYEHLQRGPSSERKWYKDLWKWWNYMSYETDAQVDEISQSKIISQSYYYKLGAPACLTPPKKFVHGDSTTRPDLEPGILNGRIFGKLRGWVKDMMT